MSFHTSYKPKLKLGESALMYTKSYKYLGVHLSKTIHRRSPNSNPYNHHAKQTIKKARKAADLIGQIGASDRGLSPTVAVKLLKSHILPIITYAAGTLIYNSKATRALEKVQQKYQKKALGLTKSTKRSIVRLLAGVPPIKAQLAKEKLRAWNRLNSHNETYTPLKLIIDRRKSQPNAPGFLSEVTKLCVNCSIHTNWPTAPEAELAIDRIMCKLYEADHASASSRSTCRILPRLYPRRRENLQYRTYDLLDHILTSPSDRTARSTFMRLLCGSSIFNKLPNKNRPCLYSCGANTSPKHYLFYCPQTADRSKRLLTKVRHIINGSNNTALKAAILPANDPHHNNTFLTLFGANSYNPQTKTVYRSNNPGNRNVYSKRAKFNDPTRTICALTARFFQDLDTNKP